MEEEEGELFIYDINRNAESSQSSQTGTHSLLQEYIETLQLFLKDETVCVMHSSYSADGAHITIDSGCGADTGSDTRGDNRG